ncbi:pleckstrin homology domain-containing family M member 2 isoform X2 [Hemicordylus capensis]|uniref:pleckstrin homology domain-containing family M member 2 isoform X2 n=1 Tax=Hemicordylus capensis TaxID=884348 RepID=UPI0023028291|nr:pleckstrin homology domain-containing family M member 2 isoform X2 [Hemicordylus capensis]
MEPPGQVKDRILENLSLSVKKLQSYFAACEDETPAIRNHDKVLQRLCEHLDHALLYGLQDLPSGYWVLVVHFTRREAIEQIEVLEHVATNLGRSRAWLYLALNENSLESYLRLFQENRALLHKYYVKKALVCSHDHLTLFLTLVSGLEFIRFDLDLDAPYLDLAPYMPDYYKPQYLLDFEERLPSSAHGSDSLSLNSFNSVTSTNLEWDDSAIAPSSEEGDLTDTLSCPRSVASELSGTRALAKSPPLRHNPFDGKAGLPLPPFSSSSAETTPVHSASQEKAEGTAEGTDQSESCPELEVIRLAKRKKTGKKKKAKAEEAAPAGTGTREGDGAERPESAREGPPPRAQPLQLPALEEASPSPSPEPLGPARSQGVSSLLDGEREAAGGAPEQLPPQPFRTGTPEGGPACGERPASGEEGAGLAAPMDFYRFTLESPSTPAPGGGHHDPAGDGQPPHVPGGPEGAGPEEEEEEEAAAGGRGGGGGEEGPAAGPLTDRPQPPPEQASSSSAALRGCKRGQGSPSLSSAEEDSGVEEGQGSPSEAAHPSEFRVDNNHLLLLMIHVFRENEEQLFRMIRMSTGHMEGTLQLVYVLLTDCYIYLIRKGAAEKPYLVEEAVSYNELDYISVGLDQQTVTLVCTNRRKQFLLDTADATLTEFFLACLRSAMIKGCREPPYPSILTDATMEKLALAKFVAQESKREISEVAVRFYGLVHWEDPADETPGPSPAPYTAADHAVTKEGTLTYKAGTHYLGKEHWKPCFVVLSHGILYQYPDQTDATPLLSVNMGGEQCGGCRRANTTDRPHSFQVILTDRPSLELSAENEEEMADWMQHLCQAVSKGVVPQGVVPALCVPCCLVVTEQKLFTCHEDCQTSFFRSLATAELTDVAAVSTEAGREYCILEFAKDRQQYLPPWVLYFSCPAEVGRFLSALDAVWKSLYQVDLPCKAVEEGSAARKKCEDALSLIRSAWQRSDSLCRGRASRDPWC